MDGECGRYRSAVALATMVVGSADVEHFDDVAAPILNGRQEVIAAMNISCHASRVTLGQIRGEFRPKLIDTANEISRLARALPGH